MAGASLQLQRLSRTRGLLVVCLESGAELGIVNDVLPSPDGRSVAALLLSTKRGSSSLSVLPFDAISSFSSFAVSILTARNAARVVPLEKAGPYRELFEKGVTLTGNMLRDESGVILGELTDAAFHRTGGKLHSLYCRIGGRGGKAAVVPINMIRSISSDGAYLIAEEQKKEPQAEPDDVAVVAKGKKRSPDQEKLRDSIESRVADEVDTLRREVEDRFATASDELRRSIFETIPARIDEIIAARGKKLLDMQLEKTVTDIYQRNFEKGWGQAFRDIQKGFKNFRQEVDTIRTVPESGEKPEHIRKIEAVLIKFHKRFEEIEKRIASTATGDVLGGTVQADPEFVNLMRNEFKKRISGGATQVIPALGDEKPIIDVHELIKPLESETSNLQNSFAEISARMDTVENNISERFENLRSSAPTFSMESIREDMERCVEDAIREMNEKHVSANIPGSLREEVDRLTDTVHALKSELDEKEKQMKSEWFSFRRPVELELRAARERLDAFGEGLRRFEHAFEEELGMLKRNQDDNIDSVETPSLKDTTVGKEEDSPESSE